MKVFDVAARSCARCWTVRWPRLGTVAWDGGADDSGDRAASGLYFVETRSEGQVDVRKVTMLK
ncbi:MAG: hypothetical protein IPI48_16815 [bacterium]|nr:hypothetical protein [bacterium]